MKTHAAVTSLLLACIIWVLVLFDASASVIAVTSSTKSNDLFPVAVAHGLGMQIKGISKRNNLPSVAVEVSVLGKGQYTFVDGFANLETHLARTLDQPFRIASITKPFAATAVLTLIDRGLLHKTDHIAKWYPHFPNADQITIDDLLRMRSGIPAPNDDEVLARVYDAPVKQAPRSKMNCCLLPV